MSRLKRLWSNLRASFWFLPSLIIGGISAVAMILIQFSTSLALIAPAVVAAILAAQLLPVGAPDA